MRKFIGFTAIFLFILIILALSLYLVSLWQKVNSSMPGISFNEPGHGDSINLNDTIPIQFTARDKQGIQQVELWIDGELYASRESALADGTSPFPLMEIWEPSRAGSHIFTARAYNTSQKYSSASVEIEVVEVIETVPIDEGGLEESLGEGLEEGGTEPSAEELEGTETDTGADSPLVRMNEGLIIDPWTGLPENSIHR